MIAEPVSCAVRSRYKDTGNRSEKAGGGTFSAIEARKDGKANCMTTVTKDSMVLQPIRIGDIGSNAQGHRVYSVRGKFQQAAEVRAVLPDFIRLICLTEII